MDYFLLNPLIIDNITAASLNHFIMKMNLSKYFDGSGNQRLKAIETGVNKGDITKKQLDEYLFQELFFGQQKTTYIFDIHKINIPTQLAEFREYSSSALGWKRLEDYCICTTRFTGPNEKDKILGWNVIADDQYIKKIRLIYGKKVELRDLSRVISYIAIEIDIEEMCLIIKVAPRTGLNLEEDTPKSLAFVYGDKVKRLFDMKTNALNQIHKMTMYKICQSLYEQLYNKMVKEKPIGIDEKINQTAKEMIKILNVDEIEKKKQINNIFDVKSNLEKMVEHILISNIIYKHQNRNIKDIEGVVTYLKFSDGSNVSARLRGDNYKDSIFDSETYMALRNPLENCGKISMIIVDWYINEKDDLRIRYDCGNLECIEMHFYRDLTEEDFYYGLHKYRKYEQLFKSKKEVFRVGGAASN